MVNEEERKVVEWMDSLDQEYISWKQFERKIRELTSIGLDESIKDYENINIRLVGATVIPSSDGEDSMYLVEDLKESILN